ncbi:MAG: hypothetical protein LBE08_07925 [Bifidobacteriaceae bacterium]|nr:hypothetical protein [Bifidobacteriaceae bacterium]
MIHSIAGAALAVVGIFSTAWGSRRGAKVAARLLLIVANSTSGPGFSAAAPVTIGDVTHVHHGVVWWHKRGGCRKVAVCVYTALPGSPLLVFL